MARLPAANVDLVVTSPPYNLGVRYQKYFDRQDRQSYLNWCTTWAAQVRRILKPSGSFFLNIGSAPSNPMLPHEIVFSLFCKTRFIGSNRSRLTVARSDISNRSVRKDFSTIATNTFFISHATARSISTGSLSVCRIRTKATSVAGHIRADATGAAAATHGLFLTRQSKVARRSDRIQLRFRFN